MSAMLERPGFCQYCNSLEPGRTPDKVPFDDWASGISSSSCHTCQIVTEAIRKLEPTFFGEARPNKNASLSVDEKCRIVIVVGQNGRGHREVDIQLYYSRTEMEHEMLLAIPQIGFASDISMIPGDAQMWSFLKECLHNCIEEHGECRAAQDVTWFPERLLLLTQSEQGKRILRLIETQHCPPSSPYITLSHCWGSAAPFCTTKQNLSELTNNIPISDLPKTFQDCLVTARELGVQYIWIDSLCIIQDDRKDWAHHAQCMDKIYENALFTVAAVSSLNGLVPFLGPEAPNDRENWQAVSIDIPMVEVEPETASKSSGQAPLKARRYDPALSPDSFYGPLEERGWAWQERFLSVRIINFTGEEARWHCKTSKTCECIGAMQKTNSKNLMKESLRDKRDQRAKEISIREWRRIVQEYSRRQLTYDTDRLPALSGIASRFYPILNCEYLAGMWLADFPRCLAWYPREISDSSASKSEIWRPLYNGVPSWSWASITMETDWLWSYNFDMDYTMTQVDIVLDSQVEIIGTSCRPSSENIFGEVETGSYIKLRGRVVKAELYSDAYTCACVRRTGFGPQHVVPDCQIVSRTSSPPYSGNPLEHIRTRFPFHASKSTKTARRANPGDELDKNKGKQARGDVYCLLLFTTTQKGKSHACILIVSELAGSSDEYQRLGIGNSDSGWSRPLYKERKHWKVWEGWEELGEWEDWERWFADAEVRTLTIL